MTRSPRVWLAMRRRHLGDLHCTEGVGRDLQSPTLAFSSQARRYQVGVSKSPMRSRRVTRWAFVFAFLGAAYGDHAARAEDGRDFAGHYDLADVIEGPDDVSLTLTLRIFNYSGVRIEAAEVEVVNSPVQSADYSTLGLLTVDAGESAVVSASLIISQTNHRAWVEHGGPRVWLEYSASDQQHRKPVELVWMPLSSEGR